MNPVTVIGIGSPYGDDQLGWQVVERLQNLSTATNIATLIRDRPGTRLLEDLGGCHHAVLVDAVCSDAPAGTLHCLDVKGLEAIPIMTSSHGLGLAETLCLGRILGILPAEILLYGIAIEPGQREYFQAPLSPPVAAAAERLSRLLARRYG